MLLTIAVKMYLITVEQGEISIWVFKAVHRIMPNCSQGYEISWEGA